MLRVSRSLGNVALLGCALSIAAMLNADGVGAWWRVLLRSVEIHVRYVSERAQTKLFYQSLDSRMWKRYNILEKSLLVSIPVHYQYVTLIQIPMKDSGLILHP